MRAVCSQLRLVDRGPAQGIEAFVPKTAFLFVGTAIFAFEGSMSCTVSIANSLSQSDRPHFFKLYSIVRASNML